MQTCAILTCSATVVARGWCRKHYKRWYRYGDPLFRVVSEREQTCTVAKCTEPHDARGFCRKHYKRWKQHGDPLLCLTSYGKAKHFLNGIALVYNDFDCLIWPFARDSDGYGQIALDGRVRHVHRIICEKTHGPPPTPTHEAAHSCGNGYLGCVNRRHLRWKTHKENMEEMSRHMKNGYGARN